MTCSDLDLSMVKSCAYRNKHKMWHIEMAISLSLSWPRLMVALISKQDWASVNCANS